MSAASLKPFPNKLNFHPHLHPVKPEFVSVTEFSNISLLITFLMDHHWVNLNMFPLRQRSEMVIK